jgi:hypothetical protein
MPSSFNKIDMNKYKNILNKLKKDKDLDYYDEKYKILISGYSDAYLQGAYWYVGKSFKEYATNTNINNLYIYKLEYIRQILLNLQIE